MHEFQVNQNVVDIEKYEAAKEQDKIVVCDFCKNQFLFSQFKQIVEEPIVYKGEHLWLTYLECPICGHKYKSIIDDKETYKLKREYQKAYARLIRHNEKGRQPERWQIEKVDKLKNRLVEKYKKIDNKYAWSFQTLATLNK